MNEVQIEDVALQALGAAMEKRLAEVQAIGKDLLGKSDWREIEMFKREDPFENVVSLLDSVKHGIAQLRKFAEAVAKENESLKKEKDEMTKAAEEILGKYSRLLQKKEVDCPECEGSGKTADGAACEKCKGKGVLRVGGGEESEE